MRNRNYVLTAALALGLLLSACGGNDGAKSRGGSQAKGVNEVLESGQQAAESQKADGQKAESQQTTAGSAQETVDVTAASRVVEESSEASVDLKGADGTDIDLTKLSATMVFSEVYNIMVNPDSCMGKTIRMKGIVAIYHDETKDTDYYSCIVQDATACCAQGIEFKLMDNYRFPDDYPPEGSEITVRGRFDVYKEGEYKYAVLKDAVLENVNTQNEGETTAP